MEKSDDDYYGGYWLLGGCKLFKNSRERSWVKGMVIEKDEILTCKPAN